ncbi:hypothetical protein [Methylomonas methanica]|nr:hypothetical protein [Methylomonas methanica]
MVMFSGCLDKRRYLHRRFVKFFIDTHLLFRDGSVATSNPPSQHGV